MRNHLDVLAVAALLRKVLRESFPKTTFSVRCERHSGGISIRVAWHDGPSHSSVRDVCQVFASSDYDEKNDLWVSRDHMLDGRRASFGCDFVSQNREPYDGDDGSQAEHSPTLARIKRIDPMKLVS
jgi:hypothetical protein